MSWPFWVVVEAGQNVYDAIKDGEWYVSKMAAEATIDQLSHINKKNYYLIGADLEQTAFDRVLNAPKAKVHFSRSISEMKSGESGYVVPWALGFTKGAKTPFIKLDYTIRDQPGGTSKMLVQKIGAGFYQVTVPKSYEFDSYDPPLDMNFTYNVNLI